MHIISQGFLITPDGRTNGEMLIKSRGEHKDYSSCNADHWICVCNGDEDDDDCDPIFCGYHRGYNNYDDYCYCDEDDCDCHCEYDKQ